MIRGQDHRGFADAKACAQCSREFERKPGQTRKAFDKARYCCRECKWEAARRPDSRPSVVAICAFEGCDRTFWTIGGDQKYCRSKDCLGARFRARCGESIRLAAEQAIAEKELDRLIQDQAWEMANEYRMYDDRDLGATLILLGATNMDAREMMRAHHRRLRHRAWRHPRWALRTRNDPPAGRRPRHRLVETQLIR
jgi:hypothetical protein